MLSRFASLGLLSIAALAIPDPDIIWVESPQLWPESIVFSPEHGLVVSSVSQGTLFKVDIATSKTLLLVSSPDLLSSAGFAIQDGIAYICHSNISVFTWNISVPFEGFQTGLLKINISSNEVIANIDLSNIGISGVDALHFANDVVLTSDGTAFVTDSFGLVWCITPDNQASVFAANPAWAQQTGPFGPNGITLIDDELLIVGLMGSGLEYRIDIETGNIAQIEFSNVEAIYSPDCQRYIDGRLLTVSNAAGVLYEWMSLDNWATMSLVKATPMRYAATTSIAYNGKMLFVISSYIFNPSAKKFPIQVLPYNNQTETSSTEGSIPSKPISEVGLEIGFFGLLVAFVATATVLLLLWTSYRIRNDPGVIEQQRRQSLIDGYPE